MTLGPGGVGGGHAVCFGPVSGPAGNLGGLRSA